MARFEITAPDGKRYEVVAPDQAGEDQVLEYFKANYQSAKPSLSAGETAVDVAKSAGIGLAQGGIGLATLPGNLEALGRAGIDFGARTLGIEDPKLSERTFLPTYTDAKSAVEDYTGKFYEPKSTLGEYARTAGEFGPLAIGGPATIGARAARVLAPAVVSETAGQMSKGTALEPWARIAGAMVGARAPMPGAAPRAPRDPQTAAAVQRLDQEGINAMTAAQRTGSVPMRWIEDATSAVPGGGGRALAMQERAAEQFTAAALRRAGIQGNRATPDVVENAFQRLGAEYNTMARSNNLIANPALTGRLAGIVQRYERITPEAMRIPMLREVAADITARGGLTGTQYAGFRSSLRRAQRGVKGNPQASHAIGELVDAMDRALVLSAPRHQRRELAHGLRDLNTRYRNMLAIEDAAGAAGEQAAKGLISPAALKNAVKKQNVRDYTRGRSELGQLARAGETVLRPLRSSGTAERTQAQNYISAPAGAIGAVTTGTPEGLMLGFVPPVAKALTARSIMSRPGQAMVQNEPVMNLRNADRNALARFAAPLLAQREQGLRGGSGPAYDEIDRLLLNDR